MSVIATLDSGGAEILVRNLSLEFARRGHACHIAYLSEASALGASEHFEQAFRQQLAAAGISCELIGYGTRRNWMAGALRLRRMVKAFRPDIVHIHLGYGLLFEAIGLVRVPTVYTHHNIRLNFPAWLFHLFDRFVDRYVAICNACAAMLGRYVKRPITLIPNGVPPTFSIASARTRLPRDVNILSVGRLTAQKDYANLIDAAARLKPRFLEQGRQIRFQIAGDGPERRLLQQAIEKKGLSEVVTLLGTREDVPALMADADLLVLSSRFEGLPITLIEGAMSALPAVATDVGGCADIVEDGRTGYLVPAGDPELLAQRIGDALADEERYISFSAAARRTAERFTLEACAAAHLALYGEVAVNAAKRGSAA
jgi:glycosyltransferase involved in cell wall biosynthesis